jgi:cell division protein FtsW
MLNSFDKPLFYITLTLFIGGLLILASASAAQSIGNFNSVGYYTLKQLLNGGLIGIAAFMATQWISYRFWKKMALPLIIISFILLTFLFIPELSLAVGGARRWLDLGPITFQPSEILKLSFIIYLASWLDARRKDVSSFSYGFVPFSLMLSIIGMFLIMQPDIGTLGVVAFTAALLYFLGGGRISQIVTIASLGLIILYFLVQLAPYRLDRILVFWNPNLDPQGIGYQINQAFIAIGSGGFWGLGFGKSIQKYNYLPESMTDSIFAIFAEEMGFLGVLLIIAAFGGLLWRGMVIAKNASDIFGKLLASGIVLGIIVQAFINMAAISGLLPLTGIPLPFVSYGGTSFAVTLASIGILMNISKHT